MPGLSQWVWPDRKEQDILASVSVQASRRVRAPEPVERLEECMENVLKEYPRTSVPLGFRESTSVAGNSKLLEKRIRNMIATQIKMTSSPGVPYTTLATTNQQLFDEYEEFIIDVVMQRVERLKDMPSGLTPAEKVQQGYADPVRWFIKYEPHAMRKSTTKKWRLIMSVSVVDQIIERLLFSNQNSVEIRNHLAIPSQPGMGLAHDEQTDKLWELFRDKVHEAAEADVSGFDWSVQDWQLMWDAEARIRLMGAEPSDLVSRVIRNRVRCLIDAVFVTARGKLVQLQISGIQLSGSYNTSATNSRMRWMVAKLVGVKWAYTMGDDCVEQYVPGAEAAYAKYGWTLRMYERCVRQVEFCSHIFSDAGVHPSNVSKTVFRFVERCSRLGEVIPEEAYQLRYLVRHSPESALIDSIIKSCEKASRTNSTKLNVEASPSQNQEDPCL